MLDPQIVAYLDETQAAGGPPVWEVPVDEQRRAYDAAAAGLFGEPHPVASVQDTDAEGVPVRIYTPHGASGQAATVYFHGGGWVNGSLTSHNELCQTLAAGSGQTLIAVDYRLAPEHVFPAAIEDAWQATHWAKQKFTRLAVAGDSAGGQLAASVALRARDASLRLRRQVLIYPVTDNSFNTDSYRANTDPRSLDERDMRWFWGQYLPDGHRGVTRDYAPLQAGDLDGVAPALVLTAEHDPLRDEGEMYAERLRAAGVDATLHRYRGMVHGFIRWPARIDAARDAIDAAATALRSALA